MRGDEKQRVEPSFAGSEQQRVKLAKSRRSMYEHTFAVRFGVARSQSRGSSSSASSSGAA